MTSSSRRKTVDAGLSKALHGLTKGRLVDLAEDLCRAVPPAQLPKVLGRHVHLDSARAMARLDSPDRLLRDVRAFHEATMAGDYYESFDVNSKNFMMKSDATVAWGEECRALLKRCQAASGSEKYAQAREGFDLLLDLLARIDRGEDIVFFADEAGSWQVSDLDPIWPAYFASLAATAGPEDYVSRVRALVRAHASGRHERLLRPARKAANAHQRRQLRPIASSLPSETTVTSAKGKLCHASVPRPEGAVSARRGAIAREGGRQRDRLH